MGRVGFGRGTAGAAQGRLEAPARLRLGKGPSHPLRKGESSTDGVVTWESAGVGALASGRLQRREPSL